MFVTIYKLFFHFRPSSKLAYFLPHLVCHQAKAWAKWLNMLLMCFQQHAKSFCPGFCLVAHQIWKKICQLDAGLEWSNSLYVITMKSTVIFLTRDCFCDQERLVSGDACLEVTMQCSNYFTVALSLHQGRSCIKCPYKENLPHCSDDHAPGLAAQETCSLSGCKISHSFAIILYDKLSDLFPMLRCLC